MATQMQVMEVISAHPDGIPLKDIADSLGVKSFGVTKTMSDLKKKGWVEKDEATGLYMLTEDGITASQAEAPEVVQFLDVEGRFGALLSSYGIKETKRIVSYISSVGDNVYSDLDSLKRCLIEQGIASGRVGPIVRHWAAIEQLQLPETLAAEISPGSPATRQPQRWTVLDGRPILDEEGEYATFTQALKVAQMERQPVAAGGNDEIKELKQEFAGFREALVNQQMAGLESRLREQGEEHRRQLDDILAKMQTDRSTRNEIDILASIVDGAKVEGAAWRSTIKETLVNQGLPQPKTPEQRQERITKYKAAVETDRRIDALAKNLFFGEPLPPDLAQEFEVSPQRGRPAPPPAPQRFE